MLSQKTVTISVIILHFQFLNLLNLIYLVKKSSIKISTLNIFTLVLFFQHDEEMSCHLLQTSFLCHATAHLCS